jgi:predicted O-methyltransferase YrrM
MREKLTTAVSNPGQALRFAYDVFAKASHRYLRDRGATIYRTDGPDPAPTEFDATIRTDLFEELGVVPTEYDDFRTYLLLRNFAHYYGCGSVLEIGAGLSTAVWAEYAALTGAEVASVDANFDRFERWIAGTSHERTITETVVLREGMSITADDLRAFYDSAHVEYAGQQVESFRDELDQFARASGCPTSRIKAASRFAGGGNWTLGDIVVSDGRLAFPRPLLDFYVKDHDNFDSLVATVEGAETTGVLDDLTANREWEFVWLDSGEVSSIVEWKVVADAVAPGGLVALHDVYFPKSMKNFIIAASLVADPEWDVLFVDPSTVQGLLIAQRRV